MFIKSKSTATKSQKSLYKQNNINTCGPWQYFEVLWSEIICMCNKRNIIYYTHEHYLDHNRSSY